MGMLDICDDRAREARSGFHASRRAWRGSHSNGLAYAHGALIESVDEDIGLTPDELERIAAASKKRK